MNIPSSEGKEEEPESFFFFKRRSLLRLMYRVDSRGGSLFLSLALATAKKKDIDGW